MFVREQGQPAQNGCLSGPGYCGSGSETQGVISVPDFEQSAHIEFKALNLLILSSSMWGRQLELCPILNRRPLQAHG